MTKDGTRVPVTALKASLSRYLRKVKAGEEVIVTERDRPIAKIVPLSGRESFDERLERLEREGRIRLGTGTLSADFWNLPRVEDPNALLRRALEEEREQGR